MNETPKPQNVFDISSAKSFSSRVTEALSTMSTMSKVTKPGVSRDTQPSKGRLYPRRNKHRMSMSQMSSLDNHPSQTGRSRRMVETELVKDIISDIRIIRDQLSDTYPVKDAMNLLVAILEEEYL
jgi:hypothetical protein